ncbi:hypothetical protein [Thalassococcus sp. S3]|uniref:hypothetical protein n=1 Tax=Thalassococcus sp. S3 TaxID=2017482 RepID=UPI0013EE697D|nr:hypothetical protein [Thalassococcus sp. S3]
MEHVHAAFPAWLASDMRCLPFFIAHSRAETTMRIGYGGISHRLFGVGLSPAILPPEGSGSVLVLGRPFLPNDLFRLDKIRILV